MPIKHHARKYGASRYGLERILRGFFDLLSVMFLTRYQRKPMHLFGLVGLLLGGVGFVTELYLTVLWFRGHKIGDRPLLLLGALSSWPASSSSRWASSASSSPTRTTSAGDAGDLPIREGPVALALGAQPGGA